MRKLLLILLLTWLPAQVTWAAVSVYCQHESNVAQSSRAHVGHHEHEHSDDPGMPGGTTDDSATPDAGHPDCSVCHLSAALVPAMPAGTGAAVPARIVELLSLAHPAPLPLRPERPNWPAR